MKQLQELESRKQAIDQRLEKIKEEAKELYGYFDPTYPYTPAEYHQLVKERDDIGISIFKIEKAQQKLEISPGGQYLNSLPFEKRRDFYYRVTLQLMPSLQPMEKNIIFIVGYGYAIKALYDDRSLKDVTALSPHDAERTHSHLLLSGTCSRLFYDADFGIELTNKAPFFENLIEGSNPENITLFQNWKLFKSFERAPNVKKFNHPTINNHDAGLHGRH